MEVIANSCASYWSMNAAYNTAPGVTNFTVKWIVGEPYTSLAVSVYPSTYYVWHTAPKMTALNCMPVFETVEARVTVDVETSTVQSHNLTTIPVNAAAAWSNPWVQHGISAENATDHTIVGAGDNLNNITVS